MTDHVTGAAARRSFTLRHLDGPLLAGGAVLLGFLLLAIFGPLLVADPNLLNPVARLKLPGADYWLGTDSLGRDVFSRLVYGTQKSLLVGFTVSLAVSFLGLLVGVLAGYFPLVDRIVVPILDGLMAIPGVLLAIALVSLMGSNVGTIIVAITVPEVPRMARIVRGVVLPLRSMQYVQAAISVGTPVPMILWRHIVPSTMGPLIVQATYTCASAIITEAVLSFLGVGGSSTPSWGGMVAESRQYIQIASWLIAWPGVMLSALVVTVNLLGDQLRERLDPHIKRRGS